MKRELPTAKDWWHYNIIIYFHSSTAWQVRVTFAMFAKDCLQSCVLHGITMTKVSIGLVIFSSAVKLLHHSLKVNKNWNKMRIGKTVFTPWCFQLVQVCLSYWRTYSRPLHPATATFHMWIYQTGKYKLQNFWKILEPVCVFLHWIYKIHLEDSDPINFITYSHCK